MDVDYYFNFVFKYAIPMKNDETGEICEDLMCVKCNVNSITNEETGELEEKKKETCIFKVRYQQEEKEKTEVKLLKTWKSGCSKRGRHSLVAMIITFTLFLPSVVVFLYMAIETLLHLYQHKRKGQTYLSFRTKLHSVLYAQFCAVCQAERSMIVIGKLQDERLAKMRKYVKTLPIQ
ncbi:uncharacterized protein [Halyomorpha halys]|uniref:uncharacterized protein isoform X2 n=1 Tax=Halyomorpha halys TaxID=286706 RepID=UPI0006D4F778|nr:uncharacterized protein LOC106691195 isoform X2 [Halyomorpha halys]